MKKYTKLAFLALFFSVFVGFFTSNNVSAVSDSIKKKAAFEGLYQCGVAGAIRDSFSSSDSNTTKMMFDSSRKNNYVVKLPYGLTDASDNNTDCWQLLGGFRDNASSSDSLNQGLLPTTIQNSHDHNQIKKYFDGSDGKGSMGYTATRKNVLKPGQKKQYLSLSIKDPSTWCQKIGANGVPIPATPAFVPVLGGASITAFRFPTITEDVENGGFFYGHTTSSDAGINVPGFGTRDGASYTFCNEKSNLTLLEDSVNSDVGYTISGSIYTYEYDPVYNRYQEKSDLFNITISGYGNSGYTALPSYSWFDAKVVEVTDQDDSEFDHYEFKWTANDFMVPVKKLASTNTIGYSMSVSTYSDLALTKDEVRELYQHYINKVFQAPVACKGDPSYENFTNAKVISWDPTRICKVSTVNLPTVSEKVYGVKKVNGEYHFIAEVTLDDVIKTLGEVPAPNPITEAHNKAEAECEAEIKKQASINQAIVDSTDAWSFSGKKDAQAKLDAIQKALQASHGRYSKQNDDGTFGCIDIEGVTTEVNVTPDAGDSVNGTADFSDGDVDSTDTPGEVEHDPCYSNAGALGWIMCPIITTLDGVFNWAYDAVETKFLRIEVNDAFTMKKSDGSPTETYAAWQIMVNIANIAFIIMLLIVILSQLTGVGIDNYGIKKTLPKLIVAAILVNISYIICQLAIDLSNVLGISLRSMLENIGGNGTGTPASGFEVASGFATGTLAAGLSITLIGMFSSGGWFGIILVVLLALLALVIGILFLFITLITRHAALVILVVIAPLGLVCYMLPNTNRLFKKWVDAMKGLLLLYPICSLVIGGGRFAGRVLSSLGTTTGESIYNLAAMLIQIVPFFLIPSLMRGSLKAIGNIGEKINGIGKNFSRATRGAIDRGVRGSERYKDYTGRRAERRSDRFHDAQMGRHLSPKHYRRLDPRKLNAGLMSRVAKWDDEKKEFMRHADGSYVIDEAKLAALSTTDRKRLMNMQARKRDNETLDSRVISGGHRISTDSIAAQRAQYRTADQAQEVKDKEAQIVDGSFHYDVSVNGNTEQRMVDANDINSLQEALKAELKKDEKDVDTSKVKALQNILSSKGDKGRSAVSDAMTGAQAELAAEGKGNVSHKARQAYSENINDRWGADYKNNQRSTYEFAQANSLAKQQVRDPSTGQMREETDAEFDARIYSRGAARQQVSDGAGGTRAETDAEVAARLQASGVAGAGQLSAFQSGERLKYDSIRANQLGDMDDNELERFIRNADADQFQQLQSLAMDALADDSSTNLKTERQRLLTNIANMSQADITAGPATSGGVAKRNDFNSLMNSNVTAQDISQARQKAKDRTMLRVQLHNNGGSGGNP